MVQTRYGTFEFKVMPFGLAGAPSTFQHLMHSTFIRELDDFVIVYRDDVLIYSRSKREHLAHLRTVFERAREHQLYLNPAKCEITNQRATYLGFVIEPGKVSPDPKKVETVRDWPEVLKDRKKQLRGFLGMVGFYRKLIPNFNKLAHPLHQLLKETSDMHWRPKHSRAVHDLKDSLVHATNLHIFDPGKPMVIKTDASQHAIGAVLEQEGQPVAFESRKLSTRDQFLPAYESELLAIVYALTKWKSFMGTKLVMVETDHATLSRMLLQKK
ncbi:retroelement [Cystoisospora suis]|uniref:Retroelement n=1 Tax=Cystoisospora suis TaxID=483139 RepID=A0A2C6JZ69_9APIC|nr:retroelement [Cystoisospora suis]